jgi:hypothetical protein
MAAEIAFQNLPLPQRDKILLHMVVTHEDNADHRPIHLWVQDGDTKTAITLTDSGQIETPLRPDWVNRAVLVQTDQPKGSLHEGVDIGIAIPAARPIPVAYLCDAIRQAQAALDAGTRQAVGFLAMFVTPKLRGVKLTASPCCTQTASLTGVSPPVSITQDANGQFSLDGTTLAAHDTAALAVTGAVAAIDPWMR